MGGGSKNPFSRGGLVLAIYDKLPEDAKKTIKESHEETKALQDALNASGIKEKLQKADKGYYALSPSFLTFEKETKYSIVCWLNPYDQQNVNYGWFTIEELEQWVENKGPIPKEKK